MLYFFRTFSLLFVSDVNKSCHCGYYHQEHQHQNHKGNNRGGLVNISVIAFSRVTDSTPTLFDDDCACVSVSVSVSE